MRAGISQGIWLSLLAFLAMLLPALAQFGAGIEGTVPDQTAAVLKGAKVTVTNRRPETIVRARFVN